MTGPDISARVVKLEDYVVIEGCMIKVDRFKLDYFINVRGFSLTISWLVKKILRRTKDKIPRVFFIEYAFNIKIINEYFPLNHLIILQQWPNC